MVEQDKRIDIDDIPRAQEELTDDEAKNVQGGLTKTGPGTLTLNNPTTATTIGGALGSDVLNTTRKSGDGSV